MKTKKRGGEIVILVYSNEVLYGDFFVHLFDDKREAFVNMFDRIDHAAGGAIFLKDEEHELMVYCVEGLDYVNEHNKGFDAVLFSELEGGFL